jgi:RimJ/RimL family protein N-acetyltransferase
LYNLLFERTKEQSISHKAMPSYEEHLRFIASKPYLAWYVIAANGVMVGAVYLSKQREIGISIFKQWQGQGFAWDAVTELMRRHPGRFLANINPANAASIGLFTNLDFKHIQNTYELEPK